MVNDLRLSQRGQSWQIEVWDKSYSGDTEVLLSLEDTLIEKMANWIKDNKGRRTAWNIFEFKTKNDALLFIMRWS
jgi:hypothetical protein